MQESPDSQAWRDELVAGLRALRGGEFARAEEHFDRAHRAAPDRPEVCFALGRERLRQGRAHEAEPLLDAAWRADFSLISAGATLARCLGLHLDRMGEAHAVLDEAEARFAGDAAIEVTRAELFVHEGRMDEAEERAASALAACGDDAARIAARAVLARIENTRGLGCVEAGDLESALFAFKRAADRDPAWSAPHVNTGAAFAELGRQGPALAAYERAIEADPTNPLAHYNLGLLLWRAGRAGEARARLQRAHELDPDDAAVARALAVLDAACSPNSDGAPEGPGRRPPPLA